MDTVLTMVSEAEAVITTNGTTITLSHTIADNNLRLLVVLSGKEPSSITYDEIPFNSCRVAVWR